MAKLDISTKRLAISKANAQMVIVAAVTSFVAVFCLIAAHSLWQVERYQSRVVSAKESANQQLETNLKNLSDLQKSYDAFVTPSINIIGGNKSGNSDNDGDNARIVLDALPSSYDFPALTSSLEKILKSRNLSVGSISGTDDELAQHSTETASAPAAVTMPFSFTVSNVSYISAQDLIATLEHSIRPMQVDTLHMTGSASNMQLSITAHTYYQPGKELKIGTKVIQ